MRKSTFLSGIMLCGVVAGASVPAVTATKPAPHAPAKPGKPAASAKTTQSQKNSQAAALSVAAAQNAKLFTDCEAFKNQSSHWVSSTSVESKISQLIGRGLAKVDLDKREFETSAEHDKRVKSTLDLYVGDADRVVFLAPAGDDWQSYDADNEKLTITPGGKHSASASPTSLIVSLFDNSKSLGFHNGQTRMGIKFRYESVIRVESTLQLEGDLRDAFAQKVRYTTDVKPVVLPMARAEAILARSNLLFVVLGRLQEPYLTESDSDDVASLDDPVSLYTRSESWTVAPTCAYLYDARTKRILYTFLEADRPPVGSTVRVALPPPRPGQIVTQPDWLRRPTAADMERYYPERALSLEQSGTARMTCSINADGTLSDCKVSSEAPSGLGFGDAALKMASLFKMKPETRDGEPVAGATVTVPVVFKLN